MTARRHAGHGSLALGMALLVVGCSSDRSATCRSFGLVYDEGTGACGCADEGAEYVCEDGGACRCTSVDAGPIDAGPIDAVVPVDAGQDSGDECPPSPGCGAAPRHAFSHRYGGTASDSPVDVVQGASGALYVAGTLTAPSSYGGGLLEPAGAIAPDVVVARYESDGTHRWSRRYGATDTEVTSAIAVDADENVYVVGWFHRETDWGRGVVTASEDEGFLVSLSAADGALRWNHSIGGSELDAVHAVSARDDRVCIVGGFENAIGFGGTRSLEAVGGRNGFVACYDATGSASWGERVPGTADNWLTEVFVDADGVVVAGQFGGTITILGEDHVSAGASDVFVARLDRAGAFEWALAIGGVGADLATALHVADDGTVLVGGTFRDTLVAGDHMAIAAAGLDAFIVGINPAGEVTFAHALGGAGDESLVDLSRDHADTCFATGTFAGSITMEGGPSLPAAGGTDVFVARLDTVGLVRWAGSLGSFGDERAIAAAPFDAHGLVLLAAFRGRASFGGPELVSVGAGDDMAIVGLRGD